MEPLLGCSSAANHIKVPYGHSTVVVIKSCTVKLYRDIGAMIVVKLEQKESIRNSAAAKRK